MTTTATTLRSPSLMVMSVHPQHVRNMLDGVKTVELRRTRPSVEPGQPVAIYATLPTAAIVLTCLISRIVIDTPDAVWNDAGEAAAISREHYDRYLVGADTATAIHLTNLAPVNPTVGLAHLRRGGMFQPPQTWTFLAADRLSDVLAEHPAASQLSSMLDR